jgi:DNA-binding NarL/FixJ family response regulator
MGAHAEVIRVLVVDDHQVLADSLVRVLAAEADVHPVGVAPDLATARRMIAEHRPDVVLLDHALPDGEGAHAVRPLTEAQPGLAVVMLTASTSDRVLGAAMEAGAAGFISKSSGLDELVSAVRAAARGDAVVSPQLLTRLLVRMRKEAQGIGHDLTDREREILALLSRGLTNVAISEQLFLSVHTVRNHIANLSAKLGAHSKLEALAIAVREGLVEPPR